MSMLDSSYFNVLERSLNASTLRQRVIANNIANVDVPNYKRSEVKFEQQLSEEMKRTQPSFVAYRTDSRHLLFGNVNPISANVVRDTTSSMNNNGNNVDIEYEM